MALDPRTAKDASGTAFPVTFDDLGADGHTPISKTAFGADGSLTLVSAADPLPVKDPGVGTATDAEATGDGSSIGILKRIRTLLSGTLSVLSGGTYNATKPTLTTGARGDLQLTSRGALMATLFANDSNGAINTAVPGDTDSAARTGLTVNGQLQIWNATNWQRAPGDAANGLDVDVTRLPALPAGNNNIGDVDVVSLPALPAGANTIGKVDQGAPGAVAWPVTMGNPAYLFRGRCASFLTPGRAGTTGQKIFALFNGAGSGRVLRVGIVAIDIYMTVAKAITVPPPIIRIHRITAAPTNGTALTKVAVDADLSSAAQVTVLGDAQSDRTSSASALTHAVAIGAVNTALTQEMAPRFITAAGYEMFDRTELLGSDETVLREGQGILVFLDYNNASSNPTTDMWAVTCVWDERAT